MLQPKLKRGAIDGLNLAYFLLLDDTGVYAASTNEGGYNSPNPARADVALHLYGYKYRKDTADELLVIENPSPLTATQWQIPMAEDGYYYFRLLAIPVYNAGLPYVVGKIVYHEGGYYKSIDVVSSGQNPIDNPDLWEAVEDIQTDEVFEDASIYTGTSDQVVNYRAKQCYQIQVQLEAEGCCDCHSKDRTKTKTYQKIFVHLNAAAFDCLQQKYQQADEELMFLAEYCESIQCKHCNI